MTIITSYSLTIGAIVVAAMIDRCLLKRRKIDVISVSRDKDDHNCIKFAMQFSLKQKLLNATVAYTLRDKKNPRTVLTGKCRQLDFSHVGLNSEYLLFNKKYITPGSWVLDVKVESYGSRINPFYKIFPLVTTYQKEFKID